MNQLMRPGATCAVLLRREPEPSTGSLVHRNPKIQKSKNPKIQRRNGNFGPFLDVDSGRMTSGHANGNGKPSPEPSTGSLVQKYPKIQRRNGNFCLMIGRMMPGFRTDYIQDTPTTMGSRRQSHLPAVWFKNIQKSKNPMPQREFLPDD